MLQKNTIKLLRLPFSFFLTPVYFFSLSQVKDIVLWKAILVFIILHFILYPAINGYNSYMDNDSGSIGLLKNPPKPTRELYFLSISLDFLTLLLSSIINTFFFFCILVNLLASKAYSFRRIRLKKYPLIGFLTVILFQGGVTFLMVYSGTNLHQTYKFPWMPALISCFLIGCFYPLSQIYQHKQDLDDGVNSLSYKLGYKGTFLFTALMFIAGDLILGYYFNKINTIYIFILIEFMFIPVIFYFIYWLIEVIKDKSKADYKHTMRMNIIAAICTNISFITTLIINHK